jgi:pentatricopeptide repeat protein
MVLGDVLLDLGHQLVLVLGADLLSALAIDDLRHRILLGRGFASTLPHRSWRYLGRTLAGTEVLIQLCGPLVVAIGGRRAERRIPRGQGQLLLAYLVLNRGAPVVRDKLIEMLWPDGAPTAAESALSALLSKLRSALRPLDLEGRPAVRLHLPAAAAVDVEAAREALHRAESAVARERWDEAWAPARVALHTSDREFLAGVEAPWVDEQRRELEDVQLRALECVAQAGLGMGGGELAAAERSGARLIKLAQFRESGYLYLMEALGKRGNVAEAIRVYDRLRGVLMDELGIPPGSQAQELHRRLLGRRAP